MSEPKLDWSKVKTKYYDGKPGQYLGICFRCNQYFIGDKRDPICLDCEAAPANEARIKCIKSTLVGGGSYIVPLKDAKIVTDEMQDSEVGDKWTLEVIEMTEGALAKLPEFSGH